MIAHLFYKNHHHHHPSHHHPCSPTNRKLLHSLSWGRFLFLSTMTMILALPQIFLVLTVLSEVVLGSGNAQRFKSKLKVLSPSYLSKELNHQEALFGLNTFGQDIESDLYYTTRSLCNDDSSPGSPTSVQQEGYILMINRGGCSFVEKVRNAQNAMATAVIIADTACICGSEDTCVSDESCQEHEPIMDDDGTGSDITIPSTILVKQEADTLIDELISGTQIRLKLTYPVPRNVDGIVYYTLWTTPEDVMSHQFLSTFKHAAIALGDKARFQPRMLIADGAADDCQVDGNCDNQCTNDGRYCSPPFYSSPPFFNEEDVYDSKGKLAVIESLRRECIWYIYGKGDGIGIEWWDYMNAWIEECSFSQFSANCAQGIYSRAGIDQIEIDTCIADSGGFRRNQPNSILDGLIDSAESDGVVFAPTMLVNGATVRGTLTFANVIEALCWTFEGQDDQPTICDKWQTCSSVCLSEECILNGSTCTEYSQPDYYKVSDYDDDFVTDFGETAPTRTAPPVPLLTNPPVPPPTPVPVLPTTTEIGQPVQPPAVANNNDEHIVETIEIIEQSNQGDNATAFFVGLGASFGIMVVLAFGLVIYFLVRNELRYRNYHDRSTAQNELLRSFWAQEQFINEEPEKKKGEDKKLAPLKTESDDYPTEHDAVLRGGATVLNGEYS